MNELNEAKNILTTTCYPGENMRALHWAPCDADPDVWMRAAVRSDGFQYWEYILIYVDDLLVISENPKDILAKIDYYFPIKPDSIGPPTSDPRNA